MALKETKAYVTTQAKKMKKQLENDFPGTTWEIDVWNNLGWHGKVSCGTIGIYRHYYPYHNYLSYGISCGHEIGNSVATPSEWSLHDSVKEMSQIKDLILKQIETIKSDIAKRQTILDHNFSELKLG